MNISLSDPLARPHTHSSHSSAIFPDEQANDDKSPYRADTVEISEGCTNSAGIQNTHFERMSSGSAAGAAPEGLFERLREQLGAHLENASAWEQSNGPVGKFYGKFEAPRQAAFDAGMRKSEESRQDFHVIAGFANIDRFLGQEVGKSFDTYFRGSENFGPLRLHERDVSYAVNTGDKAKERDEFQKRIEGIIAEEGIVFGKNDALKLSVDVSGLIQVSGIEDADTRNKLTDILNRAF